MRDTLKARLPAAKAACLAGPSGTAEAVPFPIPLETNLIRVSLGAFDPDGRTAPAATRLEGLLAALEFLPKDEEHTKIEAAAGRGIAFLLRMQIGSGPYSGGMPGAFATRVLDSSKIRIDYVQHALCAWMRYQNLLQSGLQSHGVRQ